MQLFDWIKMNPIVKKIYVPDNDIWGFPQEYKGIKFYPIKVSEPEILDIMYSVFAYPKNYIPDKQILKMSYMKFIMYPIQMGINPNGDEMQVNMIKFLKRATKIDEVSLSWMVENGLEPTLENIIIRLKIGDVEFSEDEFENIREIILEQNGIGIDYVEQYHPELEKKMAMANRNDEKTYFKDEVFIFCSMTSKSIEEIKEYTLYQFKNQLEHMMILKDYELYKPLEVSGQISFKNGGEIKHYFTGLKKKNRYDSILIKKESYVENSDIFKL